MKKTTFLSFLLFLLLTACGQKQSQMPSAIMASLLPIMNETNPQPIVKIITPPATSETATPSLSQESSVASSINSQIETECVAIILRRQFVFSCNLPQNWDYSIYPQYSKDYYEYTGERDESMYVYFFYSETDPAACISLMHESISSEGAKGYTFADGVTGLRKVIDDKDVYEEFLYHPVSGYRITLSTSKADYLAHEGELRTFLDSVAFGADRISINASKDNDKPYHLHLQNEYLQAEMTIKRDIASKAVWELENASFVFRRLELSPDGSDTKLFLIPDNFLFEKDSRTWERCKLESGITAYRAPFEEDGQSGMEYKLLRLGCTIKIYNEETEQIRELLNSIVIR